MRAIKSSHQLVSFLACLALIAALFAAGYPGIVRAVQAAPVAPVTIITVDSGNDLDTSLSKTCASATPCTLRRAIVQARALAPALRPVLIQFDIPATAGEGYNSALGVWEIDILSTSDPAVFRTLEGGQITIDGTTQPGGRSSGPKIILVGPGSGNKDGLIIGVNSTGSHDGNVLRGLGFQNFKNHTFVNSNDNLIEDNWFGLGSDGLAPYLRNDDPQDGSGSGGIFFSDGTTGNTIQNNVFLGLDGAAMAVRGEANTIANNYIGTDAAGLVTEKQTDPSLICTPVDWLGGGGLTLDGPDHIIEGNIIAGLRQEIFASSTQPDAIWVQSTCDGCIIRNNQIGRDAAGNPVGVCGIGIDITNGEQIQVLDNEFVETEHTALFLNGAMYDANTLRGNTVWRSRPWELVEGYSKPDSAMVRYSGLPDALEFYKPAQVTEINGVHISGTAGSGSPCPNCVIELFLDDADGITETLQSLAVVTANASGNWTATLPFELAAGQGLRTTSTTAQYNTIPLISAGTTVGLSELYVSNYKVALPCITR
jgi:hypothetical protein